MDEEQSTKKSTKKRSNKKQPVSTEEQPAETQSSKWTKTKFVLGGLTAIATVIAAVPLTWGAYVYGKTTELAFNVTKTAFQHPWLTAGLVTGGVLYATHADTINERVQAYAANAQHTYAEYRLDTLSSRVTELEQHNDVLERANKQLLTINDLIHNDAKDLSAHLTPSQSPAPPEHRVETLKNKDFYLGIGAGAGGLLLGLGGAAYINRRKDKGFRVVR